MQSKEILEEYLQGTIEIPILSGARKEKLKGRLDYELNYARPSGEPINGKTNNLRRNIASLIIEQFDSDGEKKKELIHYFHNKAYTKTRFFPRKRADGLFYHKVLNAFRIPLPVREYLGGLNDPIVEMGIGKYLK